MPTSPSSSRAYATSRAATAVFRFTAQPPDLRHQALTTTASQSRACSPCLAPPQIRFLFIGSRFRSTLPPHTRSPSCSCASLRSLWPAHERTSTSKIAPVPGAHKKTPDAFGIGGRSLRAWQCPTLTWLLPHYHRRCVVSLPCSRWERVGPTRYGRQANWLTSRGLAASPHRIWFVVVNTVSVSMP